MRKATFADAKHRSGNYSKARAWSNYPRSLVAISRRLQGVIIECRDALKVIQVQDTPDTLFFVDPPYMPSTRSKVGYRYELDEAGHLALLEQIKALKGLVVLAGYPSNLYDHVLKGWKRVERHQRAAGSSRTRTEVLWISPKAVELLAERA
jgi:DNA adenine methylase